MSVIQLVFAIIIFLGLLISNVLTVLLIAFVVFRDEYSDPQGVDYYVFSLAISDLILGIFLIPLSIISLSMNQWIFSKDTCEFYAYLWYSLWLIDIYIFLLLSADRYLYVTDKKYVQYRNRTRVRCICEIFLAWSIALSYSFVPASLNNSNISTILTEEHFCTVNWNETAGYFTAVLIATVVPCLFGSIFNFSRIFWWRRAYKMQKMKRKLTAASEEYLMEPAHQLSLVLFLVFWSSWMPFSVQIYRYLSDELQVPSFFVIWLGGSQGIWKFPIMMIFCPRYRQYLNSVRGSKNAVLTEVHLETREYNVQTVQTVQTNDTELHI